MCRGDHYTEDLESCTQRPPVFNKAAPILYVQRNVDTEHRGHVVIANIGAESVGRPYGEELTTVPILHQNPFQPTATVGRAQCEAAVRDGGENK
ncbi:AF4/FMR2 family member 3 [Cricetulus griseus]|nr:AF4/FMR2 family member 3 [Cricetulus griseus]